MRPSPEDTAGERHTRGGYRPDGGYTPDASDSTDQSDEPAADTTGPPDPGDGSTPDAGGDVPRPETSADLQTHRALAVAEVLLLPFFWLAPLLLLGLGGAIWYDASQFEERFGAALAGRPRLTALATFALGHLMSVLYRAQRRQWVAETFDFPRIGLARRARQTDPSPRWLRSAVAGCVLLQLLGLVSLVVLAGVDQPGLVLAVAAAVLVATLPAPGLALLDARRLRRHDHVAYGPTRFAHALCCWLPLGGLVYVVVRDSHLHYATMIAHWDADRAHLRVPDAELGPLERLARNWSG